MSRIFICYSRKDSEFTVNLYTDLSLIGLRPWIDMFEIIPGENCNSKIQEGIQNCRYAVCILSKDSVNSKWFKEEWKACALKAYDIDDFRIIPVLKEPCDIQFFLNSIQYVDFSKSYAVGFYRLASFFSQLQNLHPYRKF